MTHSILLVLKEQQAKCKSIEYGVLTRKVGLNPNNPDHRKIVNMSLVEITWDCIRRGIPIITCIVVQKKTRLPGDYFFVQMQRAGIWDGKMDRKEVKYMLQRQVFPDQPIKTQIHSDQVVIANSW